MKSVKGLLVSDMWNSDYFRLSCESWKLWADIHDEKEVVEGFSGTEWLAYMYEYLYIGRQTFQLLTYTDLYKLSFLSFSHQNYGDNMNI